MQSKLYEIGQYLLDNRYNETNPVLYEFLTTRLAALDDGDGPWRSKEEILNSIINYDNQKMLLADAVRTIRHNGIVYSMVRHELVLEAMEQYASQPKPLDDGQEGKGLGAEMEAMRLFDKWLFEQGYRYQTNVMTTKEGSTDLVPVQMGLWYLPGMSVGGRRTSDLLNEFLKTTPLPLSDGEGEKVGLPKFLVIKDDSGTFEIWDKNRYETYVKKATDYGATPAVKIIAGFNGNEDFLFPLPSAVTGGVKDLLDKSKFERQKFYAVLNSYERSISLRSAAEDLLKAYDNLVAYLSEGQPAQGKE